MIRVVTDEEGNIIRPAILGCFQFKGDEVSIFIGNRIIKGKFREETIGTAVRVYSGDTLEAASFTPTGQRLTITNITDTGVNP